MFVFSILINLFSRMRYPKEADTQMLRSIWPAFVESGVVFYQTPKLSKQICDSSWSTQAPGCGERLQKKWLVGRGEARAISGVLRCDQTTTRLCNVTLTSFSFVCRHARDCASPSLCTGHLQNPTTHSPKTHLMTTMTTTMTKRRRTSRTGHQ